jgi:Terminase large subunit, T4likevirus-type, N-terminal
MSRRTDIIQALDPVELWRAAMHMEPDPWQVEVLRSTNPRIILNCARQTGKSQTVALKALHLSRFRPKSLVLLVSRSLRQSVELGKKVFDAYQALGYDVPESQSRLALELSNQSRILCLPGGDESGIRGFHATSVIIDEAARCSDALFAALRPSLAVGGGSLILLSTPFGARGFFHRIWTQAHGWLKTQVTAAECARLSKEFLKSEYIELGERWYAQEYLCQFVESVGQVFSDAALDTLFSHDFAPLFGEDDADDAGLIDFPALFGDP